MKKALIYMGSFGARRKNPVATGI